MGKPVAKKASGRNISEGERNTVAVKLRLDEAERAQLERIVRHLDSDMSRVVAEALDLLADHYGIRG